jgi:hypothetical protein
MCGRRCSLTPTLAYQRAAVLSEWAREKGSFFRTTLFAFSNEITPKAFAIPFKSLRRRRSLFLSSHYAEGVRYSFQVITPKAFANSSPGLERQRQPWVAIRILQLNPERVCLGRNPFRVELNVYALIPRLSLRSNLGLKLANAFGVKPFGYYSIISGVDWLANNVLPA